MRYVFRESRPADREQLREICRQTAVEAILLPIAEDEELAVWFFLDSYLACEPRSCFVAEREGRVVGYVAGTCDAIAFRKCELAYFRRALTSLVFRWLTGTLTGRYRRARSHWGLLRRIIRTISGRVGRDQLLEKKVDLLRYPARCHLQVLPEARQDRVGLALFLRFQQHLVECGVAGQHARSREREGAEAYSRMLSALGFQTVSTERYTREQVPALVHDGHWINKILIRDLAAAHQAQFDG